jgi:DNA-binding response OmpR family regulator
MKELKLLWVDDEVDMLKPFVIFLNSKGYKVDTVSNGADALSMILTDNYDLILLDEMMPGMDGLTVLKEIKKIDSFLPVVMVTKSEEEGIMEDAIASQIADYLIKPINPNQIIITIKKIFQADEIKRNRIGQDYAKFTQYLNNEILNNPDYNKWMEIYDKITINKNKFK